MGLSHTRILYTPEGINAGSMDGVMLHMKWVKQLQKEARERESKDGKKAARRRITACIGAPKYPSNLTFHKEIIKHHREAIARSRDARNHLPPVTAEKRNKIAEIDAADSYGDTRGREDARQIMAKVFTKVYKTEVAPSQLIFTAGASGALSTVFQAIKEERGMPNGRFVTFRPTYPLHSGRYSRNMFYIDGDINAENLEKGLEAVCREAKRDGQPPLAIVLCDPHNPTGTMIKDWEKVAAVLKKYPDIRIIVDQAYQGITFFEPYKALITVAPELKERVIFIRTPTKELSLPPYRTGVMAVFDEELMARIENVSIDTSGHPELLTQFAYAKTMEKLIENEDEQENIRTFYREQLNIISKRAEEMGITIPAAKAVEAGIYFCIDLSDLFGMPIPEDAKRRVFGNKVSVIEYDIDIAYALSFLIDIDISPLSTFKEDPRKGHLRISLGAGDKVMNEIMDGLAPLIITAREAKQQRLLATLDGELKKTSADNTALLGVDAVQEFKSASERILNTRPLDGEHKAKTLQRINVDLAKIVAKAKHVVLQAQVKADPTLATKAKTKIDAGLRGWISRRKNKQWMYAQQCKEYELWTAWVKKNHPPKHHAALLPSSPTQRAQVTGWQEYLQQQKRKEIITADENTELWNQWVSIKYPPRLQAGMLDCLPAERMGVPGWQEYLQERAEENAEYHERKTAAVLSTPHKRDRHTAGMPKTPPELSKRQATVRNSRSACARKLEDHFDVPDDGKASAPVPILGAQQLAQRLIPPSPDSPLSIGERLDLDQEPITPRDGADEDASAQFSFDDSDSDRSLPASPKKPSRNTRPASAISFSLSRNKPAEPAVIVDPAPRGNTHVATLVSG